MKYNTVGGGSKSVLIDLLRKKLEEEIKEVENKSLFIHTFSKANPTYTVTLSVTGHEFDAAVLLEENEDLRKRIMRLESQIRKIGVSPAG